MFALYKHIEWQLEIYKQISIFFLYRGMEAKDHLIYYYLFKKNSNFMKFYDKFKLFLQGFNRNGRSLDCLNE